MTSEDFARRHPTLWRLSHKGSLPGIAAHGLLCARRIAELAGHSLADARRPFAIPLVLPGGHAVSITDNVPLSDKRLSGILDDGLTPTDWMSMLNDRVFFWPDRKAGTRNRTARQRHGYDDEWHAFDTLTLLAPVWDRAEIAPFNTGSTVHAPPRRGRATFAPLAGLDWAEWRGRRRAAGIVKSLDRVAEVTVRDGIRSAIDALRDVSPA